MLKSNRKKLMETKWRLNFIQIETSQVGKVLGMLFQIETEKQVFVGSLYIQAADEQSCHEPLLWQCWHGESEPQNVCPCCNKSLINQLEHFLLLIEFLSISGLINSFQWILSLTSVQFSLLSSNTGTSFCPLCNLRLGLVLPHSYRVWVFNVCFLIFFFWLWGLGKQPKKAFAFSQRIAGSAQTVKGKLYPMFSEKENGNWRPFPTPLQSLLRTCALSKGISALGCGNIFFRIII